MHNPQNLNDGKVYGRQVHLTGTAQFVSPQKKIIHMLTPVLLLFFFLPLLAFK